MLDRHGRELAKGARVNVFVIAGESRPIGVPHTVVAIHTPTEGRASVGLYHGSLEDFKSTFCIPYVPGEPTEDPDTYRCPDLELIDPSTEGAK